MARISIPALAALALSACAPTRPAVHGGPATRPAPTTPAVDAALDQVATLATADEPFDGVAVVVAKDHQVLLAKGYGSVGPDTELPIGSLSKQFTAVAVLRLVDAGKVALADPVSKYVPSFPGAATIADLLHQTSGIPEYAYGINLPKTTAELVAAIAAAPGDGPGKRWAYSNTNYFLLGRVVEAVTGGSYADAILAVAKAAGLQGTRECASLVGHVAAPQIEPGPEIPPRFYDAAGAVCSTANDLIRWQDALFGGKLLAPASLAFMTTPGKLADGSPTTYGAGLVLDEVAGHRRIWHNGALPSGGESQLSLYPDDGLQIAIISNTFHPLGPDVVMASFDVRLASQALALPTPDGAALAGTYSFLGGEVKVVFDGGGLTATFPSGTSRLLFVGRTVFALADDPRRLLRFQIADGHVTAFDVFANMKQIGTATRQP